MSYTALNTGLKVAWWMCCQQLKCRLLQAEAWTAHFSFALLGQDWIVQGRNCCRVAVSVWSAVTWNQWWMDLLLLSMTIPSTEQSLCRRRGRLRSVCRHLSQISYKYILKRFYTTLYSVQNLLSSSLLSKTLKIKIYRTIILPVVLYGCETWSLTFREERRLRCLRIGCWGECLGLRGTR